MVLMPVRGFQGGKNMSQPNVQNVGAVDVPLLAW
eukprot:CAMPEP_0113535472 /NCGR_PEP_ID=MMETSP0015_2-20120614/5730_1 /TAXON_ID=2838 /ORGANISM="Odontella" /LENGTH=33 /DNA_ID=CAMNT_0000434741 /DNA_START=1088 /DNA_END=1186 /DNA_ORIENTATION=- /assembly_acc=CAM_ASM_000160